MQADQSPLTSHVAHDPNLANYHSGGACHSVYKPAFQSAFWAGTQPTDSASATNVGSNEWVDGFTNTEPGPQGYVSISQYPLNDFPIYNFASQDFQQEWMGGISNMNPGLQGYYSTSQYPLNEFSANKFAIQEFRKEPLPQAQFARIALAAPELTHTQSALQQTVAAPDAPGSRHACNEPGCERTFGRSAEFRRHKKTAHGGERFRCMVESCDYSYGRLDKVREHMARMHGISLQVERRRRSALIL